MTSTPPSTLVTLFKKKRHLAIGIYFSFCSIGSTVMPLLYGLLITYIKVKGMLLVIAGMWLLLFIVGIIIHPKKIKEIKNLLQSKNIVNTNVTKSNIKEMPLKMSQYGDVRVLGENENSNVNNNKINTDAGEINKGFLVEVENVSLKGDVGQDIMHQKTDSMKHIPKDTAAGKERNSVPNERKMKQIKQVLSNGRFWLILFIVSFSQMGNFSALYLLPSFAKEKGQSLTGITLVVSTFGICDLIGRFVFGYLGDKKAFNRFTILTCCQIVAGGGVLVLTFFDLNFIPFLISVILGLGGGIHVVYTAPLVADIVPSKIAGTASGIAFMSMFLCTAAIQTPAGIFSNLFYFSTLISECVFQNFI